MTDDEDDQTTITRTRHGSYVVSGKLVDVKVDAARNVYWKREAEHRKNFHLIDKKFPTGLTRDEKIVQLLRLRRALAHRLSGEESVDDEDEKSNDDGVTIDIEEDE